jgi:dihydroxy-acid dehydratase
VRDGDRITIDADTREMRLEVPDGEMESRRREWRPPVLDDVQGVLAKYRKLVGSAAQGAVTE